MDNSHDEVQLKLSKSVLLTHSAEPQLSYRPMKAGVKEDVVIVTSYGASSYDSHKEYSCSDNIRFLTQP